MPPLPAERRREGAARLTVALAVSLAALGYAVAVVVAAWRAPDKGFVVLSGRRVVAVTPGGVAEAAGIRRGDVVIAIDGAPVGSTLAYAERLLGRAPGDRVEIDLARGGLRFRAALTLRPSRPPIAAIGASCLAFVLLALGLVARVGRPSDPAARRFFRTTVAYALVYTGALSWSHLVVHPVLGGVFLLSLFVAPALATDFTLAFPTPLARSRAIRIAIYAPSLLLCVGTCAALVVALAAWREGRPGDAAVVWTVRLIGVQLAFSVLAQVAGLVGRLRGLRTEAGEARGQLQWLLFGLGLSLLPGLAAIPVAAVDLERFLLVGYPPFVAAAAILWFATASLAVLRVRLADVDAVIRRSVVYAVASSLAAGIYLAVALSVGLGAQRLGAPSLLGHLVAAIAAAALFGPIRGRVTLWLDRRFFRDRLHYVQALRALSEAAARVREPRETYRDVVAGVVEALRASSGALYLRQGETALALAHAQGEFAETASIDDALTPPAAGVAVPIRRGGRTEGALVLGARRGGDLYGEKERDLLGALAGQLAVAFENARAFGTIAEMSRELSEQNREIRELRDRLEDENRYLQGRLEGDGDVKLVGSSRAIRELKRQLERVAATPATVLLVGESGTGKGLVARAIHAASDRADKLLVQVDCGAIPHGVFESELFGHERGAFTGAVRNRRGHFELADGGTLFLDEIGELPPALQPKLLRALQERSFVRVGGETPVTVDVRIVAATNRSLEDMVASGAFREDLYYRLRVVEIEVPPLRARRGDIPELVEWLLPRLCRRNHRPLRTIGEAGLARLAAYGFPGNVRELENVLERAVVLSERREISDEDLVLPDRPAPPEELEGEAPAEDVDHRHLMEAVEKKRLVAALRAAGGNRSHAARALGIPRTTLINKLRRYGLL